MSKMSNMEYNRYEKSIRKSETKEDERLEKMAKGNIAMMDKAVKILPQELLEHPNYENYLLKYGAFTFWLNEKKCEQLREILIDGFAEGLRKYPDKNNQYHNALVIKWKTYPWYEGYGIHQGMEMDKTAKNLQRKTTTTVDKIKLAKLKDDVLQLKGIIITQKILLH